MKKNAVEFIASGWPDPSPLYLDPTGFLDCDSPVVREFAEAAIKTATNTREQAIQLFYAVRDQIRYDPYFFSSKPAHYRASTILEAKRGYCLDKAIVLTAAARAAGIPAAIGTSDVVNHLTTEKLRRRMGGYEIFRHHGYAVLYINGRWLKAVPAFDIQLCRRFNVRPTEFDGRTDAILQEYDMTNRRHMEYLRDNGVWSDFPFDEIMSDFAVCYPASIFMENVADDMQPDTFTDPASLPEQQPG